MKQFRFKLNGECYILYINVFTTGRVNYELNSDEQQKHNNGNNLKVNKVKLLSSPKTLYIQILNKYC